MVGGVYFRQFSNNCWTQSIMYLRSLAPKMAQPLPPTHVTPGNDVSPSTINRLTTTGPNEAWRCRSAPFPPILFSPERKNVLRVGCLNLRGLKSNNNYLTKLLNELHIFAVSEHWLNTYDTYLIENAHDDFSAYCLCSKEATDDNHNSCAPRGSGGVALLWGKSLDHIVWPRVQLLPRTDTSQTLSTSLRNPLSS